MIKINFEGENCPSQQHVGDAGYDLKSISDYKIKSFERILISTGLHIQIPFGYVGYIMSRSGLASKNGIVVLNSPGVIDYGYSGEVKVLLMNFGSEDFEIKKGDRIAQLIISKLPDVIFSKGVVISENYRKNNGFGSSGN